MNINAEMNIDRQKVTNNLCDIDPSYFMKYIF